ncbi:zinc finger C2HC domain-containing protein 1A-like [Clarias gariepinus]
MPPLDLDDLIPGPEEDLLPCGVCRKRFNRRRLFSHTAICQKVAVKKRIVYDSSRKRTEGIQTVNPTKPEPGASWTRSDWRRTHEELIATIQADKALRRPARSPDYTQCHIDCSRHGTELCQECASRNPVNWAR